MQPLFNTTMGTNVAFLIALVVHFLIIALVVMLFFYRAEEKRFTETYTNPSKTANPDFKKSLVQGRSTRRGALLILSLSSIFYGLYCITVHLNVFTPAYAEALAKGTKADTKFLNEQSMWPLILYSLFATGLPIAYCFATYGSIQISRAIDLCEPTQKPSSDEIAIWHQMTNLASGRLTVSVFFCIAYVIAYDVRLFGYSQIVGFTMLTISYFVDLILHISYSAGGVYSLTYIAKVIVFLGWGLLWLAVTQAFGARNHPYGSIDGNALYDYGYAKPSSTIGAKGKDSAANALLTSNA